MAINMDSNGFWWNKILGDLNPYFALNSASSQHGPDAEKYEVLDPFKFSPPNPTYTQFWVAWFDFASLDIDWRLKSVIF